MLVLSSLSVAQPFSRRGRRPNPDLSLVLIALPQVQDELHLTSEQNALIDAAQKDMLTQIASPRGFGRDAASKRREVNTKLWITLLEEPQSKRFSQIVLQFEGPYAIDRPDVADKLKLTDEQREAILADRREAMSSDDPNALLKKVLDEQQWSQWQDQAGPAFQFDKESIEFRQAAFRRRSRRGRGSNR